MSKKTVVSVDLLCCKCRRKVMKLVADVGGINSIVLDSTKGNVTIIGEADPAIIIKQVRKCQKSAKFVSIGPPKEEKPPQKPDPHPDPPKTCQRCDTWFVINEYPYGPCSIL